MKEKKVSNLSNENLSEERLLQKEEKSIYEQTFDAIFQNYKGTFTAIYDRHHNIVTDTSLNQEQMIVEAIVNISNGALSAFTTVLTFANNMSEGVMLPLLQATNFAKGIGCLPVSKQLDPVLNLIDIHMVKIPPSPAPVPLPHPFMGLSFNAKDFLALAAMKVCVLGVDAFKKGTDYLVDQDLISEKDAEVTNDVVGTVSSFARMFILRLGATVKVGHVLPRTVAGTSIRCFQHAPAGGGFHPVAEKTIMKNKGHSWLGSMFVLADNAPLVGSIAHLQNACSDIGMTSIHDASGPADPENGVKAKLYVPTGIIIPIPLTRLVLTNPVPSPINPLQAPRFLLRAGFNKLKLKRAKQVAKNQDNGKPCSSFSRALNKVNKKLFKHKYTQGVYNKVDKRIKTYVGHPIDVAGGDLFTDNLDFSFTGLIPLSFRRVWYSDSDYCGPLGHGWHHSYDWALFVNQDYRRAQVRVGDGRLINFDHIPTREFPTARYHRSEKNWLCFHPDGYYYIQKQTGEMYLFQTTSLAAKQEAHLLSSICTREGFAIRFSYDSYGTLTHILDSVGRGYRIESDTQGRLTKVWTDAPELGMAEVCISEYVYDTQGNLIVHYDEIRQPLQMKYKNHLLVEEIWRNGHRWFFKYEGKNTGARCTESWGDGGIHHMILTYYQGETHVVDGEGNKTIYKHRNHVVYETIDPKGAVWKKFFNKYNELERSMDPLGHVQNQIRDQLGNLVQLIEPDGQFTQLMYEDADFPYLPTEVIDSRGGKWRFTYDAGGRLRQKCHPLGAKTNFSYNKDGLLSVISNGLGVRMMLEYDEQYNVVAMVSTTGERTQYQYDLWNRCTHSMDPKGGLRKRVLDYLGRTLVVYELDGNVIQLQYDALDNVIHFEDHHRNIYYQYKGMHKLISKSEAGQCVRYYYDSNERLRSIQNEEGQRYHFELDAVGQVIRERGFDGLEKQYKRNAVGWITEERSVNRWKTYEHDEMGRVIQVTYSDATSETFVYEFGALRQAINETGVLDLSYNREGQVIKEYFNGHQIENTYDIYGRRIGVSSSLGAKLEYQFDAWSNCIESEFNDWRVTQTYDAFGMEVTRAYTGGIQQAWSYDSMGQLLTLGVNKQQKNGVRVPHFYRQYVWEEGGMLRQFMDQGQKLTQYKRDPRGFLQQVVYEGNEKEERGVDASGNLYQQLGCKDRIYTKNRLIETKTARYTYDKAGYLIEKIEKLTGKKWTYAWNGAGMLSQVVRPDGEAVIFKYDALGRRVSKRYKSATTHYVWQGNVILHEYKTFDARVTTANDIITWVFEEDSFTPMAKIKGNKRYSLVSDHLGTPIRAYTDTGDKVWERELDSFGNARMTVGDAGFCNYLYPGQLQDIETGLAYNRFRYYDPSVGNYISQDPIGLAGGNPTLYGYVPDPTIWLDVFGLILVYRALNDKQEPFVRNRQDVYPDKVNGTATIQQHIDNGSWETQFISTTKSLKTAKRYADPKPWRGKMHTSTIIEINTDLLGNSRFIDVSNGVDPSTGKDLLKPAWKYAQKDQEVLISGKIPRESYRIVGYNRNRN
ncbi:DUF6531 domain-containing protein [Myroides sp. DF42-4-2]|uniref:DUF6531 domain-containing protein n=1 Tax=Myroides sp. DF42-4-2 TaxID=2746726 RepID=UPI002577A779|nr:DUF6531 domain-containing protein [Myroides sp. DF42-4-2]